MSQFFATNPATRPANGPREGRWERGLPTDWRSALGVTAEVAVPEKAAEDTEETAPEG
jgi:hypothetical protein